MGHSVQVLTDVYLNLPYEIRHYIAQTISLNDDDEIILQVWVHLLDCLGNLLLSTTPFTYQHPLLSFLNSTSAMSNVNIFNQQCLLSFGPVWEALLLQDNTYQSDGISDHTTAELCNFSGSRNEQTLQKSNANKEAMKHVPIDVPKRIRIDDRKRVRCDSRKRVRTDARTGKHVRCDSRKRVRTDDRKQVRKNGSKHNQKDKPEQKDLSKLDAEVATVIHEHARNWPTLPLPEGSCA